MLLIADSGSTKTEWMLLEKGKLVKTVYTDGFNPYYYGENEIARMLNHDLLPHIQGNTISEILYYGSGCSTEANCNIVTHAFQKVFTDIKSTIYHDLLGAAHALLGKEKGIACILGTGSNSCSYDGDIIIENVPSLGFMLADEGSGTYIGKLFLTAYLYDEIPKSVANDFFETYKLTTSEILDILYRKERPGKFLSKLSSFVGKHKDKPFCRQLIATAFDDFIRVQLSKYTDYEKLPIGFTGSVAFHFSDILSERLARHNLTIHKVCATPSEGLVAFHTR